MAEPDAFSSLPAPALSAAQARLLADVVYFDAATPYSAAGASAGAASAITPSSAIVVAVTVLRMCDLFIYQGMIDAFQRSS